MGQFVSLASVRGVAGAICLWGWVLSVLFMGKTLASLEYVDLPVGSIQLAAFGGLLCALLAIAWMVHRGTRGPEPSQLMAVALGCVPPLLMAALLVAMGAGLLPGAAPLVAWALSGASAAYGLRRSLALVEVFACGLPSVYGLRVYAGIMGGASLLGALVSRMDAVAATVVTCALVPFALWLLPQGRLSLGSRTESSRLRERARSARPSVGVVLIMGCLVVVGLVFGFQTSVGDVLYAGGADRPTIAYAVMVIAAMFMGIGIATLKVSAWRLAAQLLCAASVVALIPLLFVAYDSSSLAWLVCQNVLLLCTACCYGVLGFALARGGFGAARSSNGMPGLVGGTLFLGALVGGRLLGTVLAQDGHVGGVFFGIVVAVFAVLLLACVFALGWTADAPATSAQTVPAPMEAVDGTAAGVLSGAQDPGSVPVAEAPKPEVAAPAAQEAPQPPRMPIDPGVSPLVQRCNEVAWRYGLSEREHDVLILLARGLNAQQVAERMVVSRNTVKSHMAHIYGKLSIHTRAELDALLVVEEGGPTAEETPGA